MIFGKYHDIFIKQYFLKKILYFKEKNLLQYKNLIKLYEIICVLEIRLTIVNYFLIICRIF